MRSPQPSALRVRAKDDAEKPFWISYADLMTALMVLFLVAMSTALVSVTKQYVDTVGSEEAHRKDIDAFLKTFVQLTTQPNLDGVVLDANRRVFSFGTKAQFELNQFALSAQKEDVLRRFAIQVLESANSELGQRVLKHIVIDGFADRSGTYLHNLNLSINRSHQVLCALLAPPSVGSTALSEQQKAQVRELFVVGGNSFNATKATSEESRRIEMRLEFFAAGERREATPTAPGQEFGLCEVGRGA